MKKTRGKEEEKKLKKEKKGPSISNLAEVYVNDDQDALKKW